MANLERQGNMLLTKIEKDTQILACLTAHGLRVFKNYLRANIFQTRYSQIDSNIIKLSVWEFIFIFGRFIESDSNFDDLFYDVELIINEEN